MQKKEQALQIINNLVRENKEAQLEIHKLSKKVYNLENPKIKFNDSKSGLISRILDDAENAMKRNVERITKEIEHAKQKQSKG